MAAVTEDRVRRFVHGNQREVQAQVDIAADADTFDTKLKRIEAFSAVGSGGNVIDGTVSAGIITFNTGGAEANVLVRAVGR